MPNKPLRELVSIKKGKQLNIEHMVLGGTFLVLNGGITPSGYTNDWNTEANTITISEGGNSCGYVSLVNQRFWSGGHNYTLNDCKIDKHYLYQYLKHKERQIMALRVGSGLPNIQMRSLVDFEVPILNEKEHYRIGSFLSAIDRLIDKQKEKVDRIKSMKNGYLQKMFPVDDDEPVIRLKGFKGPWLTKKLGEIGRAQSGIGFPDKQQGGDQGIPFFKVSDMNLPGNEYQMLKANHYVTDHQITENRWKMITNLPAIFFAKVGAAVMLNRKRLVSIPFLLDNNTMAFSFNQKTDGSFAQSLFETIYLPGLIQIGALPSYGASEINNLEVRIPTFEEQAMIGSFFTKLTQLIEKEQALLKRYNQLKKSHLQKIFAN